MNTKKFIVVVIFVLFIFITSPVSADDVLYTPIIDIATANPGAPLSGLRCSVVNVFRAPRNGTISIIQMDGKILASTSFDALRPGEVANVAVSEFSNSNPITFAYCKITVHRKKGTIRGSLSRTDVSGNAVVVVEAR